MGNLAGDRLSHDPLLHYIRYDGQLEIDWLQKALGITVTLRDVQAIRRMDNPLAVDRLIEIGRAIAAAHVSREHFPAGFDIAPASAYTPPSSGA
jgi:hypothetical protein